MSWAKLHEMNHTVGHVVIDQILSYEDLKKKTHHNLVEITKLYSAYYSKFVLVSVIISIQVLSAFLSLIKNTSWLIKSYSREKKWLNSWIIEDFFFAFFDQLRRFEIWREADFKIDIYYRIFKTLNAIKILLKMSLLDFRAV